MIIGVVGKMASGKSTVCRYLETLIEDAEVIDVDSIAKDIYCENPDIISRLKECFGESICLPEGSIDYNNLALKIFSSRKNLEMINNIMFCKIETRMKKIIKDKSRRNCLIIDAAVLFDAKLHTLCDHIIWVRADRERQFSLLKSHSDLSDDDIKTRIDGQVISIKEDLVDFVIENNGTLKDLKENVRKIAGVVKKHGSD